MSPDEALAQWRAKPNGGASYTYAITDALALGYDRLEAELAAARAENERLTAAIEDIDAHATPLGEDEDGFVATGYLVAVGSLHRALGKIGHSAVKCNAEAERDAALGDVAELVGALRWALVYIGDAVVGTSSDADFDAEQDAVNLLERVTAAQREEGETRPWERARGVLKGVGRDEPAEVTIRGIRGHVEPAPRVEKEEGRT
jgi:hypothetical protein